MAFLKYPRLKLDIVDLFCQVYSMRILELLCNPAPNSFNLALASLARRSLAAAGHEVLFHDLYSEGFDPVLDASELARGFSLDPLVQAHCRELAEADGLLIFHPDWWGGPPALLKGWIDRVLRRGIAFELEGLEFSGKDWAPLLEGKSALVCVTTEAKTAESSLSLGTLWTKQILGRCGMSCECRVLADLRNKGPLDRKKWMASIEARLAELFPV
jgi:NAD(P)H dehydrogenase (quinone)